MSRIFLGELPIFLLLIISSVIGKTFSDVLPLNDANVLQVRLTDIHDSTPYIQRVSIAASSRATFNVTNVSSSASFIIFQIHTYQYNVTLSFDKDQLYKVSNRSVFGTNIGLYSRQIRDITTQLFVKNDNVHVIEALLVAIAYNDKAPIPGGCNMEFNTEVAPYANLVAQPAMVIVDVQPASMPLDNTLSPVCEKNPVEHEIYQLFLSAQDFNMDSYFSGIESMLTVRNILENGVKVASRTVSSPMRRVFSTYTGVGSVYAAVATYRVHSAAYVPAFSYACSPIVDPESCEILIYSSSKFVCALCFFLGLLSVYLGHTCIQVDMALPVFFTGTVIGYAMGDIGIGILIGVCTTAAWALVMYTMIYCGSLVFTLTLGFFFACVAYFCTPDSIIILQSDWIFWLTFAALTLAISVLSACLVIVAYVATCAIIASYMVILPLDYYFGSCLKYIIINFVRRATVEGFNLAAVRPPFQYTDIILVVLWMCLAIYRFQKQWCSMLSYIPI